MQTAELWRAWVAALESGEYEQAQEALCTYGPGQTAYCCLGVITELYDPDSTELEDDGYGSSVGLVLPDRLLEALALISPHQRPEDPTFGPLEEVPFKQELVADLLKEPITHYNAGYAKKVVREWITLATVNDAGYDFKTIAKMIRRIRPEYFEDE